MNNSEIFIHEKILRIKCGYIKPIQFVVWNIEGGSSHFTDEAGRVPTFYLNTRLRVKNLNEYLINVYVVIR